MSLPFFYIPSYSTGNRTVVLDESNSKHALQALRLKKGDEILLTDGAGHLLRGTILEDHRKSCAVLIDSEQSFPPAARPVTLAVSLLKNTSRFEWLLEKVTELGVSRIIPLRCERTEKENIRTDRLQSILISAMLQSQQCWLPVLEAPRSFPQVFPYASWASHACIAYCGTSPKTTLASWHPGSGAIMVCIGPEGDFTAAEHSMALANGCTTVHLGLHRLRTETAAMTAVALLTQRFDS